MLPINMDLETYNLIKEWVTKCNAHVAIDIDSSNHAIKIYTDKPGQMIGPQGKLIDEYTKMLNKIRFKEKYKFLIYEIDIVITPESPEITQEQYDGDVKAYMEYKFGSWGGPGDIE